MHSDSEVDFNENHKPYETWNVDLTISDTDSPAAGPSSGHCPGSRQKRIKGQLEEPGKGSTECRRVLEQVFGYSSFKGKQKEIIEAAYQGKDVLVVAPTGMGKSLCFQIPAIADERGLSIIVSPLLALMQNQIDNLRQRNIEVASLSSQIRHTEQQEIIRQLQLYDTPIKLLYITPERLCTLDFQKLLHTIHQNHNFNRLVVDEAHCISEWGHDFRAQYRHLGKIREKFASVPIMALTATATDAVRQDIVESLGLDKSRLYEALHPFNRSNLFYEVRYLSNPQPHNQMLDIFDFITTLYSRRGRASSGLVYCRKRQTCDDLSSFLRGKGLNAKPYHRGISSTILDKTLHAWTNNEAGEPGGVDLVVATIAFGMGIDKGDVRYIIHYDLPKSLEGFYQETGRAGRDGHPAKCVVYYSREDSLRVKQYVPKETPHTTAGAGKTDTPTYNQRASKSLQDLIKLMEEINICRHVSICRYFGEIIDDSDPEILRTYCDKMCDVCKYPDKTKKRKQKLSSPEDAANCVPQRQISFSNPPKERESGWIKHTEEGGTVGESGIYAQQKRPRPASFENTAKKAKVSLAPALVTKPFNSAFKLSKPFKAPSFVNTQLKAVSTAKAPPPGPPVKPRSSQLPTLNIEVPNFSHKQTERDFEEDHSDDVSMDQADGEISPTLDLPFVGIWEPEYSRKASTEDRKQQFQSLRRSLHRVFTEPVDRIFHWQRLTDCELEEDQVNQILFSAAVKLETTAISLSSTLEGYISRVSSIKSDIKSLREPEVWDSKEEDLEDVQEVIACLRSCLPKSKDKEKAERHR